VLLYNSLTRQLEEFKPINPPKVGMYTCGPTVYDYVTIGNWRTYTLGDLLIRVLAYLNYQVDYIMNITDVGHLTGDNLGDADLGEDRMEKAAQREKKTAWDIAKFYTDDFLKGYDKLNLTHPRLFTKATDHIAEQIDLVKKIEAKGFTYKTSDGIYFDVQKYEAAGNNYGQLSTLDKIKIGRLEPNPEKKDSRDFALWKFSYSKGRSFDSAQAFGSETQARRDDAALKRQMEWSSPWGMGFPGWHIECSAMSMKYLGERFDIHSGGEDLKSTHHPNEIAQSEAATGKKPFVKYWLHGAFLQVDGGRMGKSLGNAYTLHDLEKKGFNPLALRYFYLTSHYRKPINFTWQALEASQNSLEKLNRVATVILSEAKDLTTSVIANFSAQGPALGWSSRFKKAISNDLNMPQALDILWQMVKSNLPDYDKYDLLREWDKVLGLELTKVSVIVKGSAIFNAIKELIKKRESLRKEAKWNEADDIRKLIEQKGYLIEDTAQGTKVKLINNACPTPTTIK